MLKKWEEKINIRDFLNEDYILISSGQFDNKWKFFIVTEATGNGIKAIDHEGNDFVLDSLSSLWGFAGWKVYERKLKMLRDE